jgi:hypothetical protein
MQIRISYILGIFIFVSLSCSEQNEKSTAKSPQKAGFEIVGSQSSGITFKNVLKDDPLSDKNVLSYRHYFNGAGVGVADFNNDGLQDIFFAGNEVPNELYINKGGLTFEKLGPNSGINKNKVWASGVSIVDINNDGFKDIYVCQQGPYTSAERRNLFYINNGDLSFTEKAEAMGLDDDNYSTQAAFFDYDKDGDLDCYVMDESKYAGVILKTVYEEIEDEANMIAASGKFYENTGNLKFKDVTKKAGVLNYGYGLGLAISDFNGDNWPDIYVANDYTVPDFMYINQKDGTFKESIKDYTRQISYFGMGCDVADINNDGYVDIGVVDMAAEDHFRDKTLMAGMDIDLFHYYFGYRQYHLQYMFNSLQLNNGNNTFSNIAALAGVLKSDWSWAALFSDFNYDGYKDYYVSNGFRRYSRDNDFMIEMDKIRQANNGMIPLKYREDLYKMMPEIKLNNKLYINDGNLHFNDESKEFTHPDFPTYSYGLAQADFDNDGDIDLIINNIDQQALLLKNTVIDNTSRNFLKIELQADSPAKKLNAKVHIEYGNQMQYQEYYFVRGYESTMQECLFFGLDDVEEVDRIKVIWPDDNIQILKNIKANQELVIEYEKQNNKLEKNSFDPVFQKVDVATLGIDFKHEENEFDDFAKEILLPQKQTAFGPAIAKADINNDGLDDLFFGGAQGQSSILYLQNPNGTFTKSQSQNWSNEKFYEDVDAAFVDVNNDGFKDLFAISGGSGDFVGNEKLLVDRFYANNGKSEFLRIANVLPTVEMASYAIIHDNIDADPEEELLILGAAKPGQYPLTEKSLLYDYQNNRYVDITDSKIPDLNSKNGLIRDAIWDDLDNDGYKDLITVGEWQSVRVFMYRNGMYKEFTEQWAADKKLGWFRSIEKADLDGDGDNDFVIGNVGKNFKQKASDEYPLFLYSNDFDDNGTLDCVLAKPYKDKIVPARGKECSTEQMPFVSEKFKTYKDFASASVVDIYGKEKLESGVSLKATSFYSYIIWNEGGKFKFQKLPVLAQAFPLNDTEIIDLDKDGDMDLILAGNDYNTEYETPRLDAGNGLVLINEGDRAFRALTVNESGIFAPLDVKRLLSIEIKGNTYLIVANNNDKPSVFKLRKTEVQ